MGRFFASVATRASQDAAVAAAALAAGCCGAVGLGFVIAALWICAIPLVGSSIAPLVAAVPLALLCLAGCLLASHLARRRIPIEVPDMQAMTIAAATRFTRAQPSTALAAALIAGALAAIARPKM